MYQYDKTIEKMINFDDAIKEKTKEHNPNWQEISSIQNINNWRLWIRKNKFIIKANKSATRY